MGQLYEKNTDKALDKAALNQHQKILDIVEKNCDQMVLIVPIEKVKNEEERYEEEQDLRNCYVFKDLEPFFLESRLCRKNGSIIKRKKSKKGYVMTDNWYYYQCNKESIKILRKYLDLYNFADYWFDICFIKKDEIVLETISHEEMCSGSEELFQELR